MQGGERKVILVEGGSEGRDSFASFRLKEEAIRENGGPEEISRGDRGKVSSQGRASSSGVSRRGEEGHLDRSEELNLSREKGSLSLSKEKTHHREVEEKEEACATSGEETRKGERKTQRSPSKSKIESQRGTKTRYASSSSSYHSSSSAGG
ncbi:hypothetical protein CSUI_007157, partial [Cystoisospora suis]